MLKGVMKGDILGLCTFLVGRLQVFLSLSMMLAVAIFVGGLNQIEKVRLYF